MAGFVGADLVAGIYATGLAHSDEVRMLIDIGTNGEIVIGNQDFLVCASASAGPAFEGAECRSGMRATRGAIDHIRLADAEHVLNYSTVGSAPPAGICGTGYVDLVAEMLRVGLIDRTGRLNRDAAAGRIRLGRHGELEWLVVPAAQTGTTGGHHHHPGRHQQPPAGQGGDLRGRDGPAERPEHDLRRTWRRSWWPGRSATS